MEDTLRSHLETAKSWDRLPTDQPGIYVVKVPATKKRGPVLMVEINPPTDLGNMTKKRGLFVSSEKMLDNFIKAMTNPKLKKLMEVIAKFGDALKETQILKTEELKND